MSRIYRFVLSALVLAVCVSPLAGARPAKESKLVKGNHPRLVLDKDEFKQLKSMLHDGGAVCKIHDHLMAASGQSMKSKKKFTAVREPNGKYIAREAARRLITCAYAYRMTGEKPYLEKVAQDLDVVCSFEDWGPKSFLDVSEMAAAVSIAYDWLYSSLPKSLRTKVINALKRNALEASRSTDKRYTWWYNRKGNWNQVCNSGLVCAAVAIYEHCPELAQEVIDDAIRTNKTAVEAIYGPDGAYPEGPTYWGYGTLFEVLMLTVLEDTFGTDFGITSAPGFLRTGDFVTAVRGPMNMQFNYADNSLGANYAYPLWYLAFKNNNPALLYSELPLLDRKQYRNSAHKGYLILALKYAMKMNLEGLQASAARFYSAQGNVPVMMCRSGWSAKDHFLGVKGGKGAELHGHMDAGMFVYYADGVRWAMDVLRENYDNLRPTFRAKGRKLFDMSQTSLRWRLFRYNCRQHNTLTVNDKDHNVAAKVEMTATENTPERMAATFNLTPLFDGDLEKAERTAAMCDNNYIEIRDVLKAPADRQAHVRWTMLTEAVPEITPDGIVLTAGSAVKKLTVQGGNVTYKIWSNNLEDYDDIIKVDGKPIEAPVDSGEEIVYICGYEIDIPAGEELILTTTLK